MYGITRSKKDLKKFDKIENCKVFIGDVKNRNIFKRIINQANKDKKINGIVNNAERDKG